MNIHKLALDILCDELWRLEEIDTTTWTLAAIHSLKMDILNLKLAVADYALHEYRERRPSGVKSPRGASLKEFVRQKNLERKRDS